MLTRSLVCITVMLLFSSTICLANDTDGEKPDLEKQIKDLKAENEMLRQQMESIEAKVDSALYPAKAPDVDSSDSLMYPYRAHDLDLYQDEGYTGFIRKGSLTGVDNKLLNVNFFLGARYNAINNDGQSRYEDVDGFRIPFARVHLTGQAFEDISYVASLEFADFNDAYLFQYQDEMLEPYDTEVLHEAALTWSPSLGDCPALEDFEVTAGLTSIFLSPAGMEEPWEMDFIEYPLVVYRILPPNLSKDVGAFMHATAMEQGRLHFWTGVWNGAHRRIDIPDAGLTSPAYTAWNDGEDNDAVALMGRAQVNILDEEEYFLMLSGGVERNRIVYQETDPMTGNIVGQDSSRETDMIYNAATEFRFNDRKSWVKGEYMHARVSDVMADSEYGFYIAAGTGLNFVRELFMPDTEIWDQLEVLFRYDKMKINDSTSTNEDTEHYTAGINYFFDPEHKHDAKLQLNYVWRDERGSPDLNDNALVMQFVLGF